MKIVKKIISFLMITIITTILIVSCQNNAYATTILSANHRKIANIALLVPSFDDPYALKVKKDLENIQNENSDKVKFSFYDANNNIAIQSEIYDSLLQKDFDLIIIGPPTNSSENIVEDFILRAKRKNVSIIFSQVYPEIVSKVDKYYNKAVFIFAKQDQEAVKQGKIIVDLWNVNKTSIDKNGDSILQYVLLAGSDNDPLSIQRSKDVISEINDSGIKTQQIEKVNASWSKELAQASIQNLFLKYGDKIEAIITTNDAMAIGAVEALQKYGYNSGDKSKNIVVIGIDGLKEAKDLIDKGYMTGTVTIPSNPLAESFYAIGMNLINNLNPIENTNYQIIDGEIIVPIPTEEYIKK